MASLFVVYVPDALDAEPLRRAVAAMARVPPERRPIAQEVLIDDVHLRARGGLATILPVFIKEAGKQMKALVEQC